MSPLTGLSSCTVSGWADLLLGAAQWKTQQLTAVSSLAQPCDFEACFSESHSLVQIQKQIRATINGPLRSQHPTLWLSLSAFLDQRGNDHFAYDSVLPFGDSIELKTFSSDG